MSDELVHEEREDLWCILRRIEEHLERITMSVTDIATAQADEDSVLNSLLALTDRIITEITAIRGEVGSDPVKVQAILDDFSAEKAKILAEVAKDPDVVAPAPPVPDPAVPAA